MKRFKLKAKIHGALETIEFVVDDEDAAMVRAGVWHGHMLKGGTWVIRRSMRPSDADSDASLARLIAKCGANDVVCFVNDNSLDFRKENLVVMTKDQWQQTLGRMGNLGRWGDKQKDAA